MVIFLLFKNTNNSINQLSFPTTSVQLLFIKREKKISHTVEKWGPAKKGLPGNCSENKQFPKDVYQIWQGQYILTQLHQSIIFTNS